MALTEDQLQELFDKQALHDNMLTYARAVDRQDAELLRTTYWPDSTDDHGGYVGPGQGWADAAAGWKDRIHSCNHHVSNVLSEVDGPRAKRESMFFMAVALVEPELTIFHGGRYRDLCEKRDDVWKILNRVVIWDWSDERVTLSSWDRVGIPNKANWGRFYPADQIYGDWSVAAPIDNPRAPQQVS